MKLRLIVVFMVAANYVIAAKDNISSKGELFFPRESDIWQDTTLQYLTSLNLVYYQNKPVDSLLSILPLNYTGRIIHGMGNLKLARVLSVRYPGDIRVLIFVKDFVHMNPRSETMQWDINLFKQEDIECVEIWIANTFISSLRCQRH